MEEMALVKMADASRAVPAWALSKVCLGSLTPTPVLFASCLLRLTLGLPPLLQCQLPSSSGVVVTATC